jgi:hypothetical protein
MNALDEFQAGALLGAQEHTPSGGAVHFALLAGIVVVALVVLGVSRWRRRRESAAVAERSTSQDRSAESTRSPEKR